MHKLLDSISANNVEVIFVIFNKLYDTAVLVCKVKNYFNCTVLVDIDNFNEVNKQGARKRLDISIF